MSSLLNLNRFDACAFRGAIAEIRFRFFGPTRDRTHFDGAKRLLDYRVEHALVEYRESMLKNVCLNRDIMKAWEEQGGEE